MIPRYSREEMDKVWSDDNMFDLWLQIEIAASEAWHEKGVISSKDIKKIRKA